jgi:transcriptional regulator with XRE-family HTH domain
MGKQIKELPTPNLKQKISPELLGQAIRARRTQSHLRLEDTALLCGVAKQTLQDIEHGRGTCQLNTVLQVCTGLGIKLCILPWPIEKDEGDNDEW